MLYKKRGEKIKEIKVYFLIVNLIITTFAFSYLVSAALGDVAEVYKGKEIINEGSVGFSIKGIPGTPDTIKEAKAAIDAAVAQADAPATVLNPNIASVGEAGGTKIIEVVKDMPLEDPETGKVFGTLSKGEKLNVNVEGKIVTTVDGKEVTMDSSTIQGHIDQGYMKEYKDPGSSHLSKLFGAAKGTAFDALLTGVQWAGLMYGIGQLIGSVAGLDKEQQKAVSTALAAGTFTWKFLGTLKKGELYTFLKGKLGLIEHPGLWGIGVGIVVGVLLYKKESKEIVTFTCQPWQAPTGSRGGNDCEKCNEVEGCSEYKCKSLGQACQLLNAGTEDEKCDWVNPRDTSSPIISLWEEVLTEGYEYEPDSAVRPPARGVKILKTEGDGCIKAFTPLEFGITTDEPAQCRIDYNHTLKFDDMTYWFGESNLFLYNHTQTLSLPSPSSIDAAAPEIQHDGTYTLYVRCQDANENANVDEFSIRFCVEKGPDTTPPKIEGTSIANNMPVKYNQTSVELEVYVNEPAECRWSRDDRSYDDMENEMSCSENVWEMNNNLVYTCETVLTGVEDRQDNVFYLRCKDQPWAEESERNPNQESYKYILVGTETLNIIEIEPNGTIYGSTEVISVNLELETANGYRNGEAICYYGETGEESDWVEFFETGTHLHSQRLDLVEGNYNYYIKCTDLGGNRDDNYTEFRVETDREAPVVARVYREDELLKIVTTEDSECRYDIKSCNFKFEDGIDMPYANQIDHVAEWQTENTYYIRCSDEYGNMPLSNECSIIVRPYDVVEQKVED